MFVEFHRCLSCGKGQTYKHTFRCNNFMTIKISLYVSETTVNTMQKRFNIHRKPWVSGNPHKNWVCMDGCMDGWMYGCMDGWTSKTSKRDPAKTSMKTYSWRPFGDGFCSFVWGGYTEMADPRKNWAFWSTRIIHTNIQTYMSIGQFELSDTLKGELVCM